MMHVDVLVIGGGAAGMAAACAAYDEGTENVLLVERQERLGGILRQCIHNGFGVRRFGEDVTGVEYAGRYSKMVRARSIRVMTGTLAVELIKGKIATLNHPAEGLVTVKAKAIVLAMGCHESTRTPLIQPKYCGAGILTAGTAQRLMNMEGILPGKEIVILGTGDIGLIMARQLTCGGAVVKRVVEIMPDPIGNKRNIIQCLDDFSIPVTYSSTVVDIHGKERVEGVTIARVDEERRAIPGTEETISCDTLLLSAGLVPENGLARNAGIAISPSTNGAVVDNLLQTSEAGVFSCGNVLHIHDQVDNVSAEAGAAGVNAARFALGKITDVPFGKCTEAHEGEGVTEVMPHFVRPNCLGNPVAFMFRPSKRLSSCRIEVEQGGKVIHCENRRGVTPGEMELLVVPPGSLLPAAGAVLVRAVPEPESRVCGGGSIPHCIGQENSMKNLVCLLCPTGCGMCYEFNENGLVFLVGNKCRRGSEYVHQEMLNPMRTLTCLLPVPDRPQPLSVKTAGPIPKRLYWDAIASINATRIKAPVACGDVLNPDICGTGVALVATQDIP